MPGVLILDELQSATEGGGIKLAAPLQTQDGADLLSPTGQVSVNFDNVANNVISGDKIHGGIISGFSSTGIQDNANSVAMTINSDGNVGINEQTPDAKLQINNTSVNFAKIGTSNKGHYFESQSDENTDGFEIYQQHGSNSNRNSFIVNDNRIGSKSPAFLVGGNGNVGIGTSSPLGILDVDGYHIKDNATYGRTWYYGRDTYMPHLVHVGFVTISTSWQTIFDSTTGGHQGYWFEVFFGLIDVCCNSTSGGYARGRVQGSASYSGGGGIDESTYIGAQLQVQVSSNRYIQTRLSTGQNSNSWYTLRVYGSWNYNTHTFPLDS